MATRRSSKRSSRAITRRVSRAPARAGKKSSKTPWIIGGVAAAGVIGLLLWKSRSASAAPNVLPPAPSGPTLTPLQQAAVNTNNSMAADGYSAADVPVYKAMQATAGLTQDGWPGQNTYNAVVAALASISPPVAPSSNWNPAYTFSPTYGFDGVHSPTVAQWFGAAGGASYTGSTDIQTTATAAGLPAGGQGNGATNFCPDGWSLNSFGVCAPTAPWITPAPPAS